MSLREVKHKKSLFAILAFLILTLAGATIAYFADRASFDNSFLIAGPTHTYEEEFTPPVDWKPCDVTPKTAIATNTRGNAARVRLSYQEFWKAQDGTTDLGLTFVDEDDGQTKPYAIIHFQNVNDWEYDPTDGYYYYEQKRRDLRPLDDTVIVFHFPIPPQKRIEHALMTS